MMRLDNQQDGREHGRLYIPKESGMGESHSLHSPINARPFPRFAKPVFLSGSDGAQQLVSTCTFNLVREMCARSSCQPSLKLTGACGGWVMVMRGAQQNDADGCPLRDASDQRCSFHLDVEYNNLLVFN